MDRRELIRNMLLISCTGFGTVPKILEYSDLKKFKNFGLQLSTIAAAMAEDLPGTLEEVAKIGYLQVEFSALGFLGHDVLKVKDILLRNKLSAPVGRVAFKVPPDFMSMPRDRQMQFFSTQASLDSLKERIELSMNECKIMGQKILIIPAIMPHNFTDLDKIRKMIAQLKESSKRCRDAGILLGYHNHNWEFNEVGGTIPFEMMLQELDPDLFTFQLDTYWVRKAERIPGEMLAKYPGRFITCHLKDIDQEGDFEDVGYGEINFSAFIKKAKDQGAKYFFVERDTSEDPFQSIKRSYQFLKNMKY